MSNWTLVVWGSAGSLVGLFLERWALQLPQHVLAPYRDQIDAKDWLGPGGGLALTHHPLRQWGLALLNAWIWALMASWVPAPDHFWTTAAWALCGSTLLVLAMVDWNCTLLPDALVLPLLWAGLLVTERGGTAISLSHSLWASALWYAALRTSSVLYTRWRNRTGIGEGDAKLMAAMAAWWGWEPVLWALLAGAIYVPLLAGWLAWRRSDGGITQLPYGPGLITGLLIWTQWQVAH